jgi:hypothetical protein
MTMTLTLFTVDSYGRDIINRILITAKSRERNINIRSGAITEMLMPISKSKHGIARRDAVVSSVSVHFSLVKLKEVSSSVAHRIEGLIKEIERRIIISILRMIGLRARKRELR